MSLSSSDPSPINCRYYYEIPKEPTYYYMDDNGNQVYYDKNEGIKINSYTDPPKASLSGSNRKQERVDEFYARLEQMAKQLQAELDEEARKQQLRREKEAITSGKQDSLFIGLSISLALASVHESFPKNTEVSSLDKGKAIVIDVDIATVLGVKTIELTDAELKREVKELEEEYTRQYMLIIKVELLKRMVDLSSLDKKDINSGQHNVVPGFVPQDVAQSPIVDLLTGHNSVPQATHPSAITRANFHCLGNANNNTYSFCTPSFLTPGTASGQFATKPIAPIVITTTTTTISAVDATISEFASPTADPCCESPVC